jgi:hypothetical protein
MWYAWLTMTQQIDLDPNKDCMARSWPLIIENGHEAEIMEQLTLFDTLPVAIVELEDDYVEECDEHQPMLTSYCNNTHCLHCGEPIDHECMVLSPAFLKLEWDCEEIDFSEILDLAEPRLPKVNETRRKYRQWFAPRWVAQAMAALADIYCQADSKNHLDVLEPTCGAGMLLAVHTTPRAGRLIGLDVQPQSNWADLKKYGIEFYDTSAWGWLGSLEFSYQRAHELGVPAQYDVIMCHPPFGRGYSGSDKGTNFTRKMVQWARTQSHLRKVFDPDVYSIFIGHFLRFLKPNGVMICLTPNGWWTDVSFEKMRRSFLESINGYTLVAGVDFRDIALWKDAAVHCCLTVIRASVGSPEDPVTMIDASKLEDPENLATALLTLLKPKPF